MATDERIRAALSAAMVAAVQVCGALGIAVDWGAAADVCCAAAMLAACAWGVWKNHNFTQAAAEGQRAADAVRAVYREAGVRASAEQALELTGGVCIGGQQAGD